MDQQRLDIALSQRMFLIEHSQDQTVNRPLFMIKGSSNSVHKVILNSTITCSCIDYKKRKQPCKHVYFVLFRILQANMEDVNRFILSSNEFNIEYLDKLYKDFLVKNQRNNPSILKPNLRKKYKQLIQDRKEQKQDINALVRKYRRPLGEDCSICYETIVKENNIMTCQFCWNNFHTVCINHWKRTGYDTCPLCRQKFIDPLSSDIQSYEKKIMKIFDDI